jgi:hypothetical protein
MTRMRAAWMVPLLVVVALAGCGKKKAGDGSGLAAQQRRSQSSEAKVNVDRIYKGAKVYFATNGQFAVGQAGPTPGGAPWACAGGKSEPHAPSAAAWADPIWEALDFQVDDPSYYSYSYQSDGATMTVTAQGDLDCDQTPATFTMTASQTAGAFAGGELAATNPDE